MNVTGRNDLICIGGNGDVVAAVVNYYERWKEQPKEILQSICGSIDQQCESVFAYLVNNTYYVLDSYGNQFIKSPARLLNDGTGDCKSLTMFLACCLHCLHIPHIIRFVNFDGGNQFTHVYCVALDENGKEIVLDPCEKDDDGVILYNYARPYKKKKDFIYHE